MKNKFFLFALFFLLFFGFAKTADAQILFCVCSANCGGGINQCLTAQGQIINSGPCNTQPCTSCTNTRWDCGSCSASCGGGTQTCTSNCGETGTFLCNRQECSQPPPFCGDGSCLAGSEFCSTCPSDCGVCTTPTPAPIITPPPQDTRTQDCINRGGYCASTTTNCNAPQDIVHGGTCSDNTLCCKAKPPPQKGVYKTTEQCSSQGTWTITDTVCTQNQNCTATNSTPPDCDTGEVCPASECGVVCGDGLGQCYNERLTGGGNCKRKESGVKPCTRNCPRNDQTCVANACIDSNTIAGNVFVDINQNKIKDAGESNYTGSIDIRSTGGTVTTGGGTYTVTTTAGSYTVSYNNLPTGYQMIYPLNGPPPSFSVSVGPSCSTGSSNSARCVSGNIIDLNYGINNLTPWIQGIGASLRLDSGFTSKIPTNSACGSYASLPGSGGTPGLVFTGSSTPDFGQGQASQEPYNWVVGGPTYPNLYAPTRQGGVVKTSYNYVLARARQGSISPIDIASFCTGGISNCTLSGSIPHGVYIANGNLRLNSFTFPANQNFVILVTGDLTILGKIFVPTTSVALFTASADIRVDRNVGEGSHTSTASSIEGIYSADRSFIIEGINNCTTGTDIRFNVAGSVIVNAALGSGSFQNLRNLCGGNVCPAFSVSERPDFILNTPDFLRQPNFTYQEIAP